MRFTHRFVGWENLRVFFFFFGGGGGTHTNTSAGKFWGAGKIRFFFFFFFFFFFLFFCFFFVEFWFSPKNAGLGTLGSFFPQRAAAFAAGVQLARAAEPSRRRPLRQDGGAGRGVGGGSVQNLGAVRIIYIYIFNIYLI